MLDQTLAQEGLQDGSKHAVEREAFHSENPATEMSGPCYALLITRLRTAPLENLELRCRRCEGYNGGIGKAQVQGRRTAWNGLRGG